MSAKPDICVAAVLLSTGEVDYRMCDDAMGEALSHPDARLGVMVFYGHSVTTLWYDKRTCRTHTPGYRFSRHPVFVYEDGVFRLRRIRIPDGSIWENHLPSTTKYKYKITPRRETSALIDNKKIAWIMGNWIERNA